MFVPSLDVRKQVVSLVAFLGIFLVLFLFAGRVPGRSLSVPGRFSGRILIVAPVVFLVALLPRTQVVWPACHMMMPSCVSRRRAHVCRRTGRSSPTRPSRGPPSQHRPPTTTLATGSTPLLLLVAAAAS